MFSPLLLFHLSIKLSSDITKFHPFFPKWWGKPQFHLILNALPHHPPVSCSYYTMVHSGVESVTNVPLLTIRHVGIDWHGKVQKSCFMGYLYLLFSMAQLAVQ